MLLLFQVQVSKLDYYHFSEETGRKSKMALFSLEVVFIPFLECLTMYSKYFMGNSLSLSEEKT